MKEIFTMPSQLEQLVDAVIETDFLVVGGGLAGCLAALQAKRKNKNIDITIMEKSTIEYAGSAIGLKDFHIEQEGMIEHPLPDEMDAEQAKKSLFGVNRFKGMVSSNMAVVELKNWVKPLAILEDIGVQIREDDGTMKGLQAYRRGTVWGSLVYDETGKPYAPDMVLYRGSDLKTKLARAIRKAGIRVVERTMITSLITKGETVVGATGFNMRTGKFILFKAKAIIIATGRATRMYPYQWAPFPNNLFYSVGYSGNHGGGIIAALNGGAKVHNMEYIWVYAVSKGSNISSGSGGAGWYFPMMNSKGEYLEEKYADRNVRKIGGNIPPVNFMYAPSVKDPEIEREVITSIKSPATDELVTNIYFCAATEQPRSLKFHMLAGGPRNDKPIECIPVCSGLTINGIMRINEYAETSLKNLFAAGDCAGHTAGCRALAWGFIVGDHVALRVKELEHQAYGNDQLRQIEEAKLRTFAPLNRKVEIGVNPLELEDYVRNLNLNYVGVHKIEPRLKWAVEKLRWVKEEITPAITASNFHELMRALEVQDIIELSEMHAQTSLMRTESRMPPIHNRDDYPEQDKNWDSIVITARKIGGVIHYKKEKIQ